MNHRSEFRRQYSAFASDLDLVASAVQSSVVFKTRKISRRHSSITIGGVNADATTKCRVRHLKSSQSLTTLPSTTSSSAPNVKTNLTKEEWKKRMSSLMEEDLSEDFNGANEPKDVSLQQEATAAVQSSLPFALAFIGVVIGGVGANICFEKLNQLDPGCGAVITLLQYVVAVAERAPNATTYMQSPAIPYTFHVLFCVLLFCGSWLGNTCLAFDLPFSLFLVIKNSNLAFTLLVGAIALGKRYSRGQIFAVVLVSAGVVMAVLEQHQQSGGATSEESTSSNTLVGILLCACATLCMACLSCAQEYTFGKYKLKNGKTATKEAMFFTHALGLPFFISGGLWQHVIALAVNRRVAAPLITMNVASMVLCKTNIFRLIELSSSLTTTLAITFSRFLGIVISVCFLSSSNQSSQQPGLQFWVGALAVVAGSISYLMGQQQPKSKQA